MVAAAPFKSAAERQGTEVFTVSTKDIEYQLEKDSKPATVVCEVLPWEFHDYNDVFPKEASDSYSTTSRSLDANPHRLRSTQRSCYAKSHCSANPYCRRRFGQRPSLSDRSWDSGHDPYSIRPKQQPHHDPWSQLCRSGFRRLHCRKRRIHRYRRHIQTQHHQAIPTLVSSSAAP